MPAEWEAHRAMWLALPHDAEEWGQYFHGAQRAVAAMCREIRTAHQGAQAPEDVALLRSSKCLPADVDALNLSDARVLDARYGDIWLRDTGPIFVADESGRGRASAFHFNGWGGKYIFEGDPEVAEQIASIADRALTRYELICEGGALDTNGAGTFLTTRQCLLNPNRNPGRSEEAIEAVLADALGCKKLVWLGDGLAGDHTDGHVDNLARFVGETRVVCMDGGAKDPNAEVLRAAQRDLREARTAKGEALDLVTLPSPGRVEGPSGIMAASYCNFLICNACVLVPVFGVASDKEALSVFAELFPSRRIVAIEAFDLLTGGGTLHCISQQEPVFDA